MKALIAIVVIGLIGSGLFWIFVGKARRASAEQAGSKERVSEIRTIRPATKPPRDPNLELVSLFIGYDGLHGTLDGVLCQIDNCEVDVEDVCNALESVGAGAIAPILRSAYAYYRHAIEEGDNLDFQSVSELERGNRYDAAMSEFGRQVLAAEGVEILHEAYRTNMESLRVIK